MSLLNIDNCRCVCDFDVEYLKPHHVSKEVESNEQVVNIFVLFHWDIYAALSTIQFKVFYCNYDINS